MPGQTTRACFHEAIGRVVTDTLLTPLIRPGPPLPASSPAWLRTRPMQLLPALSDAVQLLRERSSVDPAATVTFLTTRLRLRLHSSSVLAWLPDSRAGFQPPPSDSDDSALQAQPQGQAAASSAAMTVWQHVAARQGNVPLRDQLIADHLQACHFSCLCVSVHDCFFS